MAFAQNLNLPSIEQHEGRRRENTRVRSRDVPDAGFVNEDYQTNYEHHLPGIVNIVEIQDDDVPDLILNNDNLSTDPDYVPVRQSSPRRRKQASQVRKRNVSKEKRSRSGSRGRKTRSRTAKEAEIKLD